MTRLFPSSAFGVLPVLPGLELAELDWGVVTSVAPFRGQAAAVDAALGAIGLRMPAPGEALTSAAGRMLWAGPGRALLIGAAVPEGLAGKAALVGQSGAAAVLAVSGTAVEAVLARLVPVDLSAPVFPPGRTARTLIGHMTASVTRTGAAAFELAVMRSMAGSLLHDLSDAARRYGARP